MLPGSNIDWFKDTVKRCFRDVIMTGLEILLKDRSGNVEARESRQDRLHFFLCRTHFILTHLYKNVYCETAVIVVLAHKSMHFDCS